MLPLTSQLAWFYPSCIPCPDHATCLSPDEDPICPSQYILKPQLLSFGNLLPLTPVCVLNRAKEYRSLQVADAVEKILQLHAGSIECSFSREKAPKNSVEYRARRGIPSAELRSQLEQLKDVCAPSFVFGNNVLRKGRATWDTATNTGCQTLSNCLD